MNFSEYVNNNYNIGIDDEKVEQTIKEIKFCIVNKIPIFIIGNGGSAYIGSHFAQDLSKIYNAAAWCLADNFGTIMAIANDISFDDVFSYQLAKFDKEKLLICISYSGNSINILNAAEQCQKTDTPIISLTGNDGGKLRNLSNININVPTENIYVGESLFLMICHYITDILKNK